MARTFTLDDLEGSFPESPTNPVPRSIRAVRQQPILTAGVVSRHDGELTRAVQDTPLNLLDDNAVLAAASTAFHTHYPDAPPCRMEARIDGRVQQQRMVFGQPPTPPEVVGVNVRCRTWCHDVGIDGADVVVMLEAGGWKQIMRPRLLGVVDDPTLVELGRSRDAVVRALALLSAHEEIGATVGTARPRPTLIGRRYVPTAPPRSLSARDDMWRVQHLVDAPLVAGWVCRFRLEGGDAEARFDITGREVVSWDPFLC